MLPNTAGGFPVWEQTQEGNDGFITFQKQGWDLLLNWHFLRTSCIPAAVAFKRIMWGGKLSNFSTYSNSQTLLQSSAGDHLPVELFLLCPSPVGLSTPKQSPSPLTAGQPWTLLFAGRSTGASFVLHHCQSYFPWIERTRVPCISCQCPQSCLSSPRLCMLLQGVWSIHLHGFFWSLSPHIHRHLSRGSKGNPVFSSMFVFMAWWSDFPLWFSLMLLSSCPTHTDKGLRWWGQGRSHLPFLFLTSLGCSLGWELSVSSSINPLSYFLNSSVTKSLTEKLQTGDPTAIWMN